MNHRVIKYFFAMVSASSFGGLLVLGLTLAVGGQWHDPDAGLFRVEHKPALQLVPDVVEPEVLTRDAVEQRLLDSLPAEQTAICAVLNGHREAYEEAPSDIKRSKARHDRAGDLVKVASGKVRLVVQATKLTTTGGGDVVFAGAITGCPNFTVGTWNNSFSDTLDHTLIRPGPVWDELAEAQLHQFLAIEGKFVPDRDDLDGFGEQSMTEHGSMTGGAYLMRVSSVVRLVPSS